MTKPRVFTPLTHVILALLAVTTIAGFVSLPADAVLPVHWDMFGQPDRFAERNDALIIMPGLGVLLLLMFWSIGRFARPERLAGGRHVVEAIVPLLLAMFLAFQIVLVLRFDMAMVRIAALSVAALLIVLGNVLPKSQPNRYGGIRLAPTLADPANWVATHRFTGLAMMVAGGLLVITVLLTGDAIVLLCGVLIAVVVPTALGVAYSYRRPRGQ